MPAPGAAWDEFTAEATCWTILDAASSVEELRIPERNFHGMGLRLPEAGRGAWIDYWVNARDAVLATPGMAGGFRDGAGIFEADDTDGDVPIRVRSVWDRITPTSCRWHQAVSRDGGTTWDENWVMHWARA